MIHRTTLQAGADLDERVLFQMADYYVTTQGRQTVRRICMVQNCNMEQMNQYSKRICVDS